MVVVMLSCMYIQYVSTEIRVSCIGLRLKSWKKDPHLTAQAADKSHPLLCEGSLRSRPQGLASQVSLHCFTTSK